MYLLTEWEGRTGKYLARGQDVRTERSEVRASWPRAKYFPVRPDLTQSISILSYDHFFVFSFFRWNETARGSIALLRFARIFKEPMISRNSFGKPVKCIGTTSCLQTEKYKYLDKRLKQSLSFWQMPSEFVTADSDCKEKEINCIKLACNILF